MLLRCAGVATMRAGVAAAAAVGVLLALMTGGVWAQTEGSRCGAQAKCHDCIQTPGCLWCTNPKDNSTKNCQHADSINKTAFCDSADLQDPHNEFEVLQDDELTGGKTSTDGKIIQLKPQRIKLRLRKGVSQDVNITFRRALAYPVDLYYLMDLSNSMRDDKDNLANVSQDLANTLNSLTDQYTIGFGSFVDKVLMPFTDTQPHKLETPCKDCAPPYSFRNDMKLIKDHERFRQGVMDAKISGNLDSPEGGFDALMQAMVCKEQIGWRDVARRILVFSTDAKFHHAGDGKLAGVVVPNDAQCHLNEAGEYTAYDQFDYPSIAQINQVAKREKINIIFATLGRHNKRIYEDLSKAIETSTFGLLEEGSKNVVTLIEEQYNSISSEVRLTDNSTEDVTIVYSSACRGDVVTNTDKCGGIQEQVEVTFNLQVTANRCPASGEGSFVEVKTLEDSVILELEFVCSCNCTAEESTDPTDCSGHGQKVCGACHCSPGFSGDQCQCGGDQGTVSTEDEMKQCLANEDDTKPCSGRGTCFCGECQCKEEHISGQYCQCNRRRCTQGTDIECSGRGECDCNECRCHQGWTGPLCQCPDDEHCKQPGSDKVCSGHGTCDCGRCQCESSANDTYTGRYCEDCLRCGAGQCSRFRDCVECVHFGSGPLKPDCNACEKSEVVESLDEEVFKGARLCTFTDEEGCYVNFTYRYLDKAGRDEVFVQRERQCPPPPPILTIVFSLIGAIVAIGLLTLIIWKVLTTIHDRREYAKFIQESQNAKFGADVNPLYKGATTTVENPAFSAK